ncbi:MAG TPA: hypothetical protein VMW18_18680 [Candidatus Binatia bacterium]|nr:hypothetical protein [Candidatus Binatia bacterium]
MANFQTSETKTHTTLGQEKVRAGQTTGHVRIILTVSTILAVVALGAVLFAFAA